MLGKLLDLLESYPNQLDQDQICVHLGISPENLQSMMDILVRKGRLSAQLPQKDSRCATPCQDCPALPGCRLNKDHQETLYWVGSKT